MKRLNIIASVILLVTLLMISLLVYAKLSDETLKEVEKLRWKHELFNSIGSDIDINWESYYSWTMYFEDEKLFVETQDGKWFIEMEKVEE